MATEGQSATRLLGCLKQWVETEPVLQVEKFGNPSVDVRFDFLCFISLKRKKLCNQVKFYNQINSNNYIAQLSYLGAIRPVYMSHYYLLLTLQVVQGDTGPI